MSIEPATLLAIFAMAVATIATRFAGLVLVRRVALKGRAQRALSAVPPAVLMAVVTPTAFATGPAETVGCCVTALAALRLPLLASAALGIVCVALLRLVL